LAALLMAVSLAGCSDGGGQAEPGPDVPDLGLEATATTGVIRGVVVDDAIRPLAGVLVTATAAGQPTRQATTGDTGFFGFEGLSPGTYFLTANRTGYFETQTSVEVVAGVPDPPVAKLQLAADIANMPYSVLSKFDGFLECGLSVIALCAAGQELPVVGNLTNDRFYGIVTVERPPMLIQSEMVWEPTTAASDELWIWHSLESKDGGFNGSCDCWVQGPSPLVMVTNETGAVDNEYGTNNDVYVRIFTGSIDGTRNPADPSGCYGNPAVVTYCGGVGYSVEQPFTVYTTVFYGYLPPDGWQFTVDGNAPAPT
jgi:hypothetical protein